MNVRTIDEIANAVLYEGYLLYPYRASALKNRHRFNFGVVVPRDAAGDGDGAERASVQTECLVCADPDAPLAVRVRFLHLFESGDQEAGVRAWQEAVDREVSVESALKDIASAPIRRWFEFVADSAGQEPVRGQVELASDLLGERLSRLRVVISNLTPVSGGDGGRTALMKRSLLSTHAILHVGDGGAFVSLLDPPDELRAAAGDCQNVGLWPVMVGDEHERDAMLASPIILYDYPRIASESAGDFFDGTEIDEMLALRVLTLTGEEKDEARQTDPRARALLDRTESLSDDQLMKLHGVLRGLRTVGEPPQ